MSESSAETTEHAEEAERRAEEEQRRAGMIALGCTCECTHNPGKDAHCNLPDEPIEQQEHLPDCPLAPDLTGWVSYDFAGEESVHINPNDPSHVWLECYLGTQRRGSLRRGTPD
jgi:hypothetical protein